MLWAYVSPWFKFGLMEVFSWMVSTWRKMPCTGQKQSNVKPYSGSFDGVVGFGSKVLCPIKVTECLPTFVELALLRAGDMEFKDSIQRSFNREDFVNHTTVVLCHRSTGVALVEEFVRSNQDYPWGLKPPQCPTCRTNLFLRARITDKGMCRIGCDRCNLVTNSVNRPPFVRPCQESYLPVGKFFVLPFPHPSDCWSNVIWRKKSSAEIDCA